MKNETFYGTDMVGGGYANRTHDAGFKGQSLTTWRIPYIMCLKQDCSHFRHTFVLLSVEKSCALDSLFTENHSTVANQTAVNVNIVNRNLDGVPDQNRTGISDLEGC